MVVATGGMPTSDLAVGSSVYDARDDNRFVFGKEIRGNWAACWETCATIGQMTETLPSSSSPGRWIRAALVLLPAGTVLLGIASFGIWQWKKDRAADQSFRYAMALRRDISAGALAKHADTLRPVLNQADVMLSVPGYLRSTMGEENMGYAVRSDRFERADGTECTPVDAELSGQKRPRELIIVLVPYAAQEEAAASAVATMLVVAHDVTGQAVDRTVRFVALPRADDALERVAARMTTRGERVMRLHVLGAPPERLAEIWKTKEAGTVVEPLMIPEEIGDQVKLAAVLRDKLLREAELP